jgi:hypothetical protein
MAAHLIFGDDSNAAHGFRDPPDNALRIGDFRWCSRTQS